MDPTKIILKAAAGKAIPINVYTEASWSKALSSLPDSVKAWANSNSFSAKPGSVLVQSSPKGELAAVHAGVKAEDDGFGLAKLCQQLPEQSYHIVSHGAGALRFAELAWGLEAYGFTTFKDRKRAPARLHCRKTIEYNALLSQLHAAYLVRDLVNTPSNAMGPAELEAAARKVATANRARLTVTKGSQLAKGFPMVQTVGGASDRAPRLIDFTWGSPRAPKLTLVGKGVCFDTGGLDIKPASGMLLMKKDMGGAAHVLGLASMIMDAKLPVRLRVIIPAVENSINGNAFRPGDILRSRKGLTVEIGNTDAEGRLILADALDLADSESPDLLIDMATLTGAARVALGPELPPFYTNDDDLAEALQKHGVREHDPVWRMPFWENYYALFESSVADLNNSGDSGFAGSITAALFLKKFVEKAKAYMHFDIFAWAPTARPGTPRGGEAQAIRALFALIRERYAK